MARGPLATLTAWLSRSESPLAPSVSALLGVPSWVVIAAGLVLISAAFVGLPSPPPSDHHWSWTTTGAALGLLGVLAWLTGAPSGWRWGLSITGPSRSLLEVLFLGSPESLNWGTAMLVGVPVGTWASARWSGPVSWRGGRPGDLARRFLGGILMGAGGTLASGCNIGNALTGLSILAVNAFIATVGIVGGVALAVRSPGITGGLAWLKLVRGQG